MSLSRLLFCSRKVVSYFVLNTFSKTTEKMINARVTKNRKNVWLFVQKIWTSLVCMSKICWRRSPKYVFCWFINQLCWQKSFSVCPAGLAGNWSHYDFVTATLKRKERKNYAFQKWQHFYYLKPLRYVIVNQVVNTLMILIDHKYINHYRRSSFEG